ncbi:lamin tail domain-containing protein [Candidatus Halobonum tyrrellensis]|uniref:Nuclease n=1 Tax=Candidatus Halobonum tyrrellensis G22 TaxID=1324957 RepID=V4IYM7_9EURY|nr:lamin tail domain-containing protein [Candidatus Halobonum tyrrellensis]ESP88237.1 nuclease [Candidatus Halobonum tyrrellensis G22]
MTTRPVAAALACCLLLLAGCSTAPAPVETATTAEATPAGGDRTATPGAAGTESGTDAAGTPADGVRATVVEVVDGDTVKVELANGTRDTARLLGVDTPEVYGENTPGEFEDVPDTEAGRACLGEYGDRASAYAERRLAGETVRLTFDANEPRRGYYDRLLVYVHHDGRAFNYGLVERGLARVYDSSFEERERYYEAEAAAMEADRGLWTCRDGTPGAGTPTATLARAATVAGDGVAITRVNADAAGADGENLNDEYVVVENRGADPVDLTGWTLEDEAGHAYAFPDGATLAAGASLTLHVGAGSDTATDLYWGRSSPTLNNDGETVTLRDADGAVVAERST